MLCTYQILLLLLYKETVLKYHPNLNKSALETFRKTLKRGIKCYKLYFNNVENVSIYVGYTIQYKH